MATLFNTRIADTYQGLLKTIDTAVIGATLTQISDGSGNGTGVFLNNAGDLEATGIVSFGSLKDIGENITITKFVDAADGLINNDNDTTIPTSAAIIDYVAGQITLSDLDFSGDGGSTGSVDLDGQVFSILGTSNEITTSGSGQTLTIGLPSSVTISGTLTATTFSGDLNGTINTATTAVTQPLGDNSTKVATTAFVDRVITAQDLDFQGTTGSGTVDLDSETFIIQGTTNEITTAATGQVLTVGLPSSITTDLVGNVTGNVTGNLTGDVTGNLTGNTNGIHTGNVVGDVTGDLTGNVTGNVVGDLTGNTTGLHTGNVIGNVTGDLSGNVVGNVTGDLTGNADTATAWANGRTITLTGEATGVTPSIDGTTNVSAALTLTNSAVIDKVLTGLQSPAGATILATDSMLIAFGKLQSQINGIAEGLQYQGSWNASTNTPALASSVGTQGFYYIVNVAGSTNLNGITDWEVGDWAIFSTTGVWQRLDQTGVQGTGTAGTLTKWATGSTISDSIVSESGTALTVTGSLNTTLGSNIAGDFSVNTNKFTVGSATGNVVASGQLQGNDLDIVTTSVLSGNVTMSADASVGGTLTTASPVINTGISGSAVLDDDTFATASATTVATSESIKAYVDNNTGSGTAGTIPKWATGGESLEDSIITEASSAITVSGAVTSKDLTVIDTYANDPLIKLATNTSSNVEVEMRTATTSYNAGIGVVTSGYDFNIFTENTPKLTITSGGDVGIGISPSRKLDVQIGSGSSNGVGFINGGGKGLEIYTDSNGSNADVYINQTSSDLASLFYQLNGSTKLTISSTGDATFSGDIIRKGNVGNISFEGGSVTNINAQIQYDQISDYVGQLFFKTANGSGTLATRLTISSGGDATFTPSGGSVVIGSSGHITSTQALDSATAGGRFIGSSNRGVLGDIRIEQTTTGADGGYIRFMTSPSGSTSPTEKMRISSGGDVGINSTAYLSFNGIDPQHSIGYNSGIDGVRVRGQNGIILATGSSATPRLTISSGGAATFSGSVITPFLNVSGSASQIAAFNGTGANGGYLAWQTSGTTIADLGTAQQIFGSGGNDTFGINARGARSLILGTNNSAKLTITSGGNVLIGLTNEASQPTNNNFFIADSASGPSITIGGHGGAHTAVLFRHDGATTPGSIVITTNSTTYNTSSDYRLKENVTPITDALSRVNQLKPSRFNFIADTDRTVDGFIAHEVQDIIPEAISGEKDAVSEDGTPDYQGIDQSKIVPLLTAAIQEQQTIIDTLTARLDVLEKKA